MERVIVLDPEFVEDLVASTLSDVQLCYPEIGNHARDQLGRYLRSGLSTMRFHVTYDD